MVVQSMLVMVLMATVLVAIIAGLIGLVVNRRTRPVALSLVGGVALLGLLALVTVSQSRIVSHHELVTNHQLRERPLPANASTYVIPETYVDTHPSPPLTTGQVVVQRSAVSIGGAWLLLLLVVALLAVVFAIRRRPVALLVVGLLLGVGVLGYIRMGALRHVARLDAVAAKTSAIDQAHENWNQATKPKILLDDEQATSTSTEEALTPADVKGKHVGKSVEASHDEQEAEELDLASPTAETLPAWANQPAVRVGTVYRRVVSDGPYATADEARERVQDNIDQAVHEYLTELVSDYLRQPALVPQLGELGITRRFIRDNIVAEEFYASRDTSVAADMKTALVLLEFNASVSDKLLEQWQSHARQARTRTLTLAACGVLGVLAGALGLMKLDTATKGYYTKRLFIGVPLAIIGTGALLFFA